MICMLTIIIHRNMNAELRFCLSDIPDNESLLILTEASCIVNGPVVQAKGKDEGLVDSFGY